MSKICGSASAEIPVAIVADRNDDFAAEPLPGKPDLAARIGIFGSIVEQVADDLCETDGIGVERDRLGGKGDGQLMAGSFNQWPAGFDSIRNDRGQFGRPFAELDFARA